MQVSKALPNALPNALILLVPFLAPAPAEAGHCDDVGRELRELFQDDQKDEREWESIPEDEFYARKRVRRDRALEIVRTGQLSAPADYYHAALLMQHGYEKADSLIGHVLATVAAFDDYPDGASLSAACLDNYLMQSGLSQRFGSMSRGEFGQSAGPLEGSLGRPILEVFLGGQTESSQRLASKPAPNKKAPDKKTLRAAAKELKKLATQARRKQPQKVGEEAPPELQATLARVKVMARDGLIESSEDFLRAAAILNLGTESEELLIAHILASAAAIEGQKDARPLAARSLDRFLMAIEQRQVFATQKDPQAKSQASLLPQAISKDYGLKTR